MIEDREVSIIPDEGLDKFVSERPVGIENFQPHNPITALAIPDEKFRRNPITVAIDDQAQYDQIVGELHQISSSGPTTIEASAVASQAPDSPSVKKSPTLGNIVTAGFIVLGAVVEIERTYSRFKQSYRRKR